MTYIYVPFKKKDLSPKLKETIKKMANSLKTDNELVFVTYSGEKGLAILPKNEQIYVILPGKAGKISPFVQQNKLSTQVARFHPSTNSHLRLSEGKQTKLVPQIADEMVEDKLLDNPRDNNISIHLIYLFEEQQAKFLTESFTEALLEHKVSNNANKTIKVDYKTNPFKIMRNSNSLSEAKSLSESVEQAAKFNMENLNKALAQYREYKSSRCCGLSGLLGFNGLFSSNESLNTIRKLRNVSITDEERYSIAQLYMTQHSGNYFAECLRPFVNLKINNQEISAENSFQAR
ncbi:MAG: hypothetical protein H0U57_08325 [Tatlockia sp.]|nr:hypothetical protein [Tatlockia sp.]